MSKEIKDLAASVGVFVINRSLMGADYSFQFETIDFLKEVSESTGTEIESKLSLDKEYIHHILHIQIEGVTVELLYLEKFEEHKKTQAI